MDNAIIANHLLFFVFLLIIAFFRLLFDVLNALLQFLLGIRINSRVTCKQRKTLEGLIMTLHRNQIYICNTRPSNMTNSLPDYAHPNEFFDCGPTHVCSYSDHTAEHHISSLKRIKYNTLIRCSHCYVV